jgi:hypothetical protein
LGSFSFISSSILKNTSNGFLHKASNKILVTFQLTMFFQQNYMYSHIYACLNENLIQIFLWNHINGTLHIELKWDNELICNKWLNISSSLVIVWMVFEVYFAFCNISWWLQFFH